MSTFTFNPHTIVITVGPACCGKTTWVRSVANAASERGVTVQTISSDDIRMGLLPTSAKGDSRTSASMLMVSEQAFSLLFAQLQAHIKFPVNTDLIFVDTTGLDNNFRERVRDLGKENGYRVVIVMFDYSRGELEKIARDTTNSNIQLSIKHSKRLREEVLPNLQRKTYDGIIKFNKTEQVDAFVPEFNYDVLNKCDFIVDNADVVAVIGDVHECVKEFDKLIGILKSHGVTKYVLCGDWIDKGNDTRAMIEYLTEFVSKHDVRIALGNHEWYVFRRLAGVIAPQNDIEQAYFSSISELVDDPTLTELGNRLYERATPFVRIRSKDWIRRPIYVTHAPCEYRFVGKVSTEAIQHQRNIYFKDRDTKSVTAKLAFVEQQSQSTYPWHVFGHVAHDSSQPMQMRNSIWLDTGCAHGNKLSAVIFNGNGKLEYASVDAIDRERTDMYSFPKKNKVDDLADVYIELSEDDERRADAVYKNGAKYISGTMTPAPAVGDDIESIDAAIDYFVGAGITEVCVQPKYMGSRAQVYLVKNADGALDIEKTFATSRNGYKIRNDLSTIYRDLFDKYHNLFEQELILDGELCPWSVLGRRLIDGQFEQYRAAIEYQCTQLSNDEEYVKFINSGLIDPVAKKNHLVSFDEQLNLYGKDGDPYYVPFGIIAIDGKWYGNEDQHKVYSKILGSVGGQAFSLDDPHDVDMLKNMMDLLVDVNRMEGIVIKPRVYKEGCLPYMKVRNKQYLRLIYGYDYPDRLDRLCKQKSIRHKSRVSIEEYQLGRLMVEQPELRKKAIYAMFGQIAKERDLDPRL